MRYTGLILLLLWSVLTINHMLRGLEYVPLVAIGLILFPLAYSMYKDIEMEEEEQIITCGECGGDDLAEELHINTNDNIFIDGKLYYSINTKIDTEHQGYYCLNCKDYVCEEMTSWTETAGEERG